MKKLLIILFVLVGFIAKAQLPANTFISRSFTGNTKAQWILLDSPLVNFVGSSLFNARYAGTQFVKIGGGDTAFYFGAGGNLWFRSLLDRDTIALSNRINLKLNISDTASMLSHYLRKTDTTGQWVTGIYRKTASDSVFYIKGGQSVFGFRDSIGAGGSGLTSVGLSMPSAFTVTGSPLTVNGTIAVSGAGTTSQYIRGNGTLATTDTSMIPSFSVKVRGLFSGAAPITLDQSTGTIGAINANASGTKGVATFNNTDFTDNGSGLISLRNPSGNSGVDTIFRTPGIDSIYFTINSVQHSILDSAGGGGSGITQLTGDVTAGPGSGSQAATIAANAVTNGKFRQSAGLSIIGRASNSTGNIADIIASSDSTVLFRKGSTLQFGKIDTSLLQPSITPGSCTLCNLTYDRFGNILVASNGSVGGIPTLDAVLGAGNSGNNKDIFLSRTSGGQEIVEVRNFDTSSNNAVARFNSIAYRGKAVFCIQNPDSTDGEVQYFNFFRRPGTWDVIDSAKVWIWGFVGTNHTSDLPALVKGFRLVDVAHGNLQVINVDTNGRIGFTSFIAPRAWVNIPSGGSYAGLNFMPEGTPTNPSAGDMHNTGNQITFADLGGNLHNLVDQVTNAGTGSFSGGGPFLFTGGFAYATNQNVGFWYSTALQTQASISNNSNHANLAMINSNSTGWNGLEIFDNNFNQQAGMFVDNADNTKLWFLTRASKTMNWQAGSSDFTTRTAQLTLTTAGNILITNLKTGSTAPTPSGTTKMVITDANGQLSFDNIPSGGGITSINSQTGASQTVTASNGLTETTTTNTSTITLGGTLSSTTTINGGSNSLNLGAIGSKINILNIFTSSYLSLNTSIVYGTDATNTDADYTVPATVRIAEVSDVLSTGRTLTLPSPGPNGTVLTLVMKFSSGSNKYSLSAAVTDNATGSTFTTLDWGKTYDFFVDQSLAWRLIRKY